APFRGMPPPWQSRAIGLLDRAIGAIVALRMLLRGNEVSASLHVSSSVVEFFFFMAWLISANVKWHHKSVMG
ncbi:MAG: hypothetical protein KDM64_10335, partial [Verrucomicrobiae bacterium]|nr:hypothetical protein [Verrucomicrobiae bacterium]